MILKAKERGNARQLARYLLSMRDNEHVELHDLRGFVSDDLHGALLEAEAISMGTRCVNHLFSLSLNPPEYADVPLATFEKAIERIEAGLGLQGQPRAIVFHDSMPSLFPHDFSNLRMRTSDEKCVILDFHASDAPLLAVCLKQCPVWFVSTGKTQ